MDTLAHFEDDVDRCANHLLARHRMTADAQGVRALASDATAAQGGGARDFQKHIDS